MKTRIFGFAIMGLLLVGCGSVDIHDNNVTIINQASLNNNEAVVDTGKTDTAVNEAAKEETVVEGTQQTMTEIHNITVRDLTSTGFTISWDGGSGDCVVFLKSFDKGSYTQEIHTANAYTYTKLSEESSWVVYVKDNLTGKLLMYPSVVTTITQKSSYEKIGNLSVSHITASGFTITWEGGSGNCAVYLKSNSDGRYTKEILAINSYTYTQLSQGSQWEVFVKDHETGQILKYGAIVTIATTPSEPFTITASHKRWNITTYTYGGKRIEGIFGTTIPVITTDWRNVLKYTNTGTFGDGVFDDIMEAWIYFIDSTEYRWGDKTAFEKDLNNYMNKFKNKDSLTIANEYYDEDGILRAISLHQDQSQSYPAILFIDCAPTDAWMQDWLDSKNIHSYYLSKISSFNALRISY